MRKLFLIGTMLLLATALIAPGAFGAQLSLTGSHVLTTSVIGDSGAIDPSSGYIYSDTYGVAYYNPSEYPGYVADSKAITFGTGDTASAVIPATTWLKTTSDTTAYDGGNKFTMKTTFVGNAPSPSVPNAYDGYLSQYSGYYYGNYFQLNYVIPTAGSYTAKVSDLYDMVFKLVNADGGSNYFYSTNGYSYLYAEFYAPTGNGTGQKQVLADYRYNYPNAVPDFDVSLLGKKASVSVSLDDLNAGDTVSFYGYIYTDQYGNSNNSAIPLPPSVLLLGSGLLGVALLGRRKLGLKK
jgi:hypothetical protein